MAAAGQQGTVRFDLAADDGGVYRIDLAVPPGPAPAGGHAVALALDGNAAFAIARDAARLQAERWLASGAGPLAVVGVGYPIEGLFDVERRAFDYLPSAGGADRFLDFLAGPLLAELDRRLAVDRGRLALIGHSLGGLFALHACLARPGLFRVIVAGSPSIWLNEDDTWGRIAALERSPPRVFPPTRLALSVGEHEQSLRPECTLHPEATARTAHLARGRMVENTRAAAERLMRAAPPGLEVDLHFFPDEDHASVIPATLSRGVRLAASVAAAPVAATP